MNNHFPCRRSERLRARADEHCIEACHVTGGVIGRLREYSWRPWPRTKSKRSAFDVDVSDLVHTKEHVQYATNFKMA